MNALDLSLYLVLDPDLCGGPETLVRTAHAAAEHGASAVQLRAPNWKKRQWLETAEALKAVLAPFGVPLIINDHVDIALAVDAHGVHVGQDDLAVADVRRLIGPHRLIGLSTHNPAQADAAVGQGADEGLAALGTAQMMEGDLIGSELEEDIGTVVRNLKTISELTAKMTVMTGYSSRDYVGETRIVSL